MTSSSILWFLVSCSILTGVVVNAELCPQALADPFAAFKTHFLLWTRRNPIVFQPLIVGNPILLGVSNYEPTNPTIIYAHGWTDNGQNILSLRMRDSFLQREDCNFISVDWQFLALPPAYPKSVANVQPVGELTGNLVNFLISQGADRLKFHLLGFSLGAHVVGRAGLTTTDIMPRITGFDPAFPCFEKANRDEIIDSTDAEFVDIIHTNAGLLFQKSLGFPFSLGHADFWPNGGSIQPGCGPVDLTTNGTIGNIAAALGRG
ncbi:inactive pancreatic lipase-related protein 1-like [Daphnia pulex]|uniref:inactive pancreatic lipase-related protein 1-like n=1 Tax=Daphnia pulex TaxID=6669 RepID=UPI001EDF29E4|nr:inactive pancreatic lipase-related protein 1-like [Daphnia pulex]